MPFRTPVADVGPFASLVDVLRWRAEHQADRHAYSFLEDGLTETTRHTYASLDRAARSIGAHLQAQGAVGERALMLYQPGDAFLPAFLGSLYAGVIAVPAYPPRLNRPDPRIAAIVNDAEARYVLTTADVLGKLQKVIDATPELQALHWIATDTLEDRADDWEDAGRHEDDLAYLQYTSGSTSTPKGVMIAHKHVLHNTFAIQELTHLDESSVSVTWLPHFHDMGLVDGLLTPLYSGYPGYAMAPMTFLKQPLTWLQAISRYGATHCGGPNVAFDLCVHKVRPEDREELDLSTITNLYCGAEPIRPQTMRDFIDAYAPHGFDPTALGPAYGMAEATLAVTMSPPHSPVRYARLDPDALAQHRLVYVGPDVDDAAEIVGCGPTGPQIEVIIADPEAKTLAPYDQIGELWVASPSVAGGYWRRDDATTETFEAHLVTGEGPYLRTGDLGFIHDGQIYITGRIKEIIIIRGRNYYPQDIEYSAAQAHSALRPHGGAAFSVEIDGRERLVVVHEVRREALRDLDVDEVVRAVRHAVSEQHELQLYGLTLIGPGRIPKTSSGKIQRRKSKVLYEEGGLEEVAAWTLPADQLDLDAGDDDAAGEGAAADDALPETGVGADAATLRRWLTLQLAQKLKVDPARLDGSTSFMDYGLDSVDAAEIADKLERWLDRPLDTTLLWDYPTLDALVGHLIETAPRPAAEPAAPAAEVSKPAANGEKTSDGSLLSRFFGRKKS